MHVGASKCHEPHIVSAVCPTYPQAVLLRHRDLPPDQNADGSISPAEWAKRRPCFDVRNEYADLGP